MRHAVASCADAAGLHGERLDDFVVAVNELLTNAVRHGGGSGRLEMWHRSGSVVCEVSDNGAGLGPPVPHRQAKPAADQPGGWGLWLAETLTDQFEVITHSDGTLVRIGSRTSLSEP